jgi:hypothetical protein
MHHATQLDVRAEVLANLVDLALEPISIPRLLWQAQVDWDYRLTYDAAAQS